jgi:nitrite reductase (NO-forming)
MEKMMHEDAEYVVFNGAAGALTGDKAMKAKVGETVRLFFGVGGPNLTSSFHIIGEVFDKVYIDGAGESVGNAQTVMVPAAGSAIVEFTTAFPGSYTLVDHSLTRLMKGAAASLVVEGEPNPMIYGQVKK